MFVDTEALDLRLDRLPQNPELAAAAAGPYTLSFLLSGLAARPGNLSASMPAAIPVLANSRVRRGEARELTEAKFFAVGRLGFSLSEKQIPHVIENLESGGKPKEALETAAVRPRQVRGTQASFLMSHMFRKQAWLETAQQRWQS